MRSLLLQVLIAAQQALDVLMQEMPPLRCADTLAHKLPSEAAISSGTAVDGEVLCSTIRCLQVSARLVEDDDRLKLVACVQKQHVLLAQCP